MDSPRRSTFCLAMSSPAGRGTSIVALSLAEGLRRRGFRLRFCHTDADAKPMEDTLVVSTEGARRAARLLDSETSFTGPLDVTTQLLHHYDHAPFGLLHLHSFPLFGVPAFMLKQLRGVPYVVTFHGSDVLDEHLMDVHLELVRGLLQGAAAVTCVSQHLADALHRKLPDLTSAQVIHNFLRWEFRRESPIGPRPPDRFLHVSSMRDVKRPELMLRAFEWVRARRPGARLRIVTTRHGRERAAALLERFPYREDVTVLEGEENPALLAREYRESSALLLTSRFESFGLVILEALAHGVPVVAPAVGGIPEVLGQQWPLLVRDVHDPAAYGERMIAVSQESPAALEAQARAIFDRFDPDRQVEQYLALYRRVLGSAEGV